VRMKIIHICLSFSLFTFLLAACMPSRAPAPALTPITLQLLWNHNASSAGFYAADQNGYYAQEGLKINFIEGGAAVDLLSPLLNGTAQFGIASADTLPLARSEDKPVCAIATIFRRSPIVFVSPADSGISRPQDFARKTIRITPQVVVTLHTMMEKVGISSSQYTEVNLQSDLKTFESGQASVWSIYLNNFGVTLQQAGFKLNVIYPDDYGVHFYGDTIFTTDDLIARNPDLVLRFLRATLKGYTFAVENPDAAAQMVSKYNVQADTKLETLKLLSSLPLINTGEDHIGWMKPEIWAGMEKTLVEQGMVTKPLDVTQVYTMQFLEEIYK